MPPPPPVLLGPLAVSRCALRVRFDSPGRAPEGVEPAPDSEVGRFRGGQARQFAADIRLALREAHPDAVDLTPADRSDDPVADRARLAEATVAAMASGAPVVVGGALPDDPTAGRSGKVDVLVRGPDRADGRPGYWPVLVAGHRTLDARRDQTLSHLEDPSVAVVSLAQLTPGPLGAGVELPPENPSPRDRLALAHLWRLLETCEHAAGRSLAAVIGTEGVVGWTDLGERGVLDAYDQAFAVRRQVIADESAWPVPPVRIPECDRCRWRVHCAAELERLDSTSLVPGIGYQQWKALDTVGVRTRRDLAALPHDDLDDPRIVALAEQVALDWLPTAIDQAWVATEGGGRPHLRREAGPLALPEADVEIDLDMENALEGCVYLWGMLVDGDYRPVVDWGQPGDAVTARVFAAFWDELRRLATDAWGRGQRMACYVWHEQAEIGAMYVGAAAAESELGLTGIEPEIRALVAPPPTDLDPASPLAALAAVHFVDLLQVYRDRCLHGSGYGLKVVAPLAGFAWDDADPSGMESMLWHRLATTDPDPTTSDVRTTMRTRLLRYNEDDVRATAAVRAWLRSAELPRVRT